MNAGAVGFIEGSFEDERRAQFGKLAGEELDVLRTGGFFDRQRKTFGRAASEAEPALKRGADEGAEQRVRLQRLGFELGMALAAQIPGVIGQFANLDVNSVRRFSRQAQAVLLQNALVLTIELVAMAVALADLACAVCRSGEAVFGQQAGISAKPHGAAQFVDSF